MSFHVSNFGSFGGDLQRFADLRGYVPQAGDSHEAMHWDGMTQWDEDSWGDFVAEAVAATKTAQERLSAWQGKITYNGRQYDIDGARALMDDELAEQIHGTVDTEQEFFDAYVKAHAEKYGEEFVVN